MILVIWFFIMSIIVYPIEFLIGKINKNARIKSSYFLIQLAFKIVLFIGGTRIHVKGTENIPKDTAVLFVGNHNSYFDILVSCVNIPIPTGYVAKKEFKKVPGLNLWMHMINCLFLDRENVREGLKTILKGADQIKSGISMVIFPEGTRSKDGKMNEFKEGSMKMALKSGCPVVPMAMKNTADIFERQFPAIKSCDVYIEFGKPIYVNELSKDEQKHLGAACQMKIQQMLDTIEENV